DAGHHVFTPPTNVGAPRAPADPHAIAGALDLFLRIHRVGSGRHRRARHDAHRLTCGERAGEHGTGRKVGDDGQPSRAGRRDVGGGHGVTVDGGVVGGRDVEGRAGVLDEHAAERLGERNDFRRGAAIDLGEDVNLAIPHRNHGAYYTVAVTTGPSTETRRPA